MGQRADRVGRDDHRVRLAPLASFAVVVAVAAIVALAVVTPSRSRGPAPARQAAAGAPAPAVTQPPNLVGGAPRTVAQLPQPRASLFSGKVLTFHFYSPALHQEGTADVYLPPGYAQGAAHGRRYPVMYLLHGSPGDAGKMFTRGAAPRVAGALIRAHRIEPLILVAPHGRYGPLNATEWANGRYGAYESFICDTVHAVDATFATIPDRDHRVIAGDSEGGFGATNIALHNLDLFGGFQSWSGYYTAPPQGTFAGMSQATLLANSAMDYVPQLSGPIHRLGLHAYLYEGAQDAYGSMGMSSFAGKLRAAGADVGSAVYPGRHSWRLWHAQMAHMLELASSWMSGSPAPRA